MGIRYYAYAFDAEMADAALADPDRFTSDDPLADAWGMPHGAQIATTNFEQSVPKTEMLYLDKAWSYLQALTRPVDAGRDARPSFRMFEGQVTPHDLGWFAWYRGLAPQEIPAIAADLVLLQDELVDALDDDRDGKYVQEFLGRAVTLTSQIAATNRGFVYMIG